MLLCRLLKWRNSHTARFIKHGFWHLNLVWHGAEQGERLLRHDFRTILLMEQKISSQISGIDVLGCDAASVRA